MKPRLWRRTDGVLEKATPDYDLLREIQAVFNDVSRLVLTDSADRGRANLGMTRQDVVTVIQGLTHKDFVKSMTTYRDSTVWQDVYKPTVGTDRLYVKFQRDPTTGMFIISFKEA